MHVCGPGRKALTCSFINAWGETPCPAGSVKLAQAACAYEESFWDVPAFVAGGNLGLHVRWVKNFCLRLKPR